MLMVTYTSYADVI